MASKRNVKRRTCERKQAYRSLGFAIKISHKMRDKYHEGFDAYHCKNCGQYHVGHRTQATRARLKALAA